jgi:very-short-patch-repair endonuclease
MNKKEYVIRQLARTKSKKYEGYVVNRVVNLLDDFELKFVTQQYVTRPKGRALTDLFFPQLSIHLEVDELYHKNNTKSDKLRELDIVNATNHEILRVDVSGTLENINSQIGKIVKKLSLKKEQLKNNNTFVPWNIEAELNPQTYIDLGYIDVSNNVIFHTIKDACNCFGHNYKGYQQAVASHPNSDTILWFPKLFPNGKWVNKIYDDEMLITERHIDDTEAKKHISLFLDDTKKEKRKRVVFAKAKGNLGDIMYRFKGLYELNLTKTNMDNGLYWEKISSRVNTYHQKS